MSEWDEGDGPNYDADRDAAIVWARELLARQDWAILDTETSGLGYAEILQLGLLAPDGTVLMDTLVKPSWTGFANGGGIEPKAFATHGIRESDCAGAPDIADLLDEIARHVTGKMVVVYNLSFDLPVLRGCLHRRGLADLWEPPDPIIDLKFRWIERDRWRCAMLKYSAFAGELFYDGGYKYQRLPGGDHSAIGDCRACLQVIRAMAAAKLSTEQQEE